MGISTVLNVNDLTKTVGTSTPLTATLIADSTGLEGETIIFTINGVSYKRVTNSSGIASLNINLGVGTYSCSIRYEGSSTFNSSSNSCTVTVTAKKLSTLAVTDLTCTYGTTGVLTAVLYGGGVRLADADVTFNINGVTYTRTTNSSGEASLNINLNVGAYTARVSFNSDAEYETCSRTVTVRVIDKPEANIVIKNLTKTYGSDTALTAKMDIPSIITGLTLYFTINGVTYTRVTDVNGEAKLNINLLPGVYPCTIRYAGDSTYRETTRKVTVTVKADTWIDGINLTKTFGEADRYQCAVYDQWGRLTNVSVDLTINEVTYTRQSSSDGLIYLNINLAPGRYPITVKFNGDTTHNASTRARDLITVKPKIETVSTVGRDGLTRNEYLQGHVQTKIYTTSVAPETKTVGGKLTTSLDDMTDTAYTSYEITETDPRIKTAKFTTNEYLDLTNGRCYAYIASPVHENFAGQILNVEYDKTSKLYTYQCQDGRRAYQSKTRIISEGDYTIYDYLEFALVAPFGRAHSIPISADERVMYGNSMLSGLHPLEDYDNLQSGALKFDNKYKQTAPQMLSYDSYMDKIMNLSHIDGFPVDVYFTTDLVCHIDPVDLDKWLSTGIKLTHQDLTSYKYGFDTTNIITGVRMQDANAEDTTVISENMDLAYIFGSNVSMISPTTTTTESDSTSSSGTSIMSGTKSFAVGCDNGGGGTSSINKVINALTAKGHSAISLGVGPSVTQNYGLKSASKGKIAVFICNGICAGTIKDFVDGMTSGYYHYDHAIFLFENCTTDKWLSCTAIKRNKQVRAHDDSFSSGIDTSITYHEYFEKHSDKIHYVAGSINESTDSLASKLAAGNLNCSGSSSTSSTSSDSDDSTTTTTTVIDTTATYNKALEEMSKSIRDLLSFTIDLPLNSPIFKNLHTNMMLWTELPREFELTNLGKIFKILPSYKVNRGVEYMENRWYVDGLKIKGDSKGVFATITLNPFPSSYSSYSNAVKDYASAYDQAFNQKTEDSTTSTSTVGTPLLGNDSTATYSMCVAHGLGYGNSGHGRDFDSVAAKGYAQTGRNYYDWARGYNDVLSLLHAIATKISGYIKYDDNRYSVITMYNRNSCNCADAARYTKVCCDSAGFPCVCLHGSPYGIGHYWNGIKYNGVWYTFDCFYSSKGTSTKGTNSIRSVW